MSLELPDERSRSSRAHTESEWDDQRETFRYYYVDQNLSLKDAAKCMKENHDFDATPRQWERRIAPDKWGFQKYESREKRLKAIDAAGKSLLEVGQRGRRKSTASDGRPTLADDRNMRRFARREASRESRRRARSVSTLSDQFSELSDEEMITAPPSPLHVPVDQSLPDLVNPFMPQMSQHQDSFQWSLTSDDGDNLQMNMDDLPTISISGADEHAAFISPAQIPISEQAQVNVHLPGAHLGQQTFHGFVPPHVSQFSPPITVSRPANSFDTDTHFPNFDQGQQSDNTMSPPVGTDVFADHNSPESYTNLLGNIGDVVGPAENGTTHGNPDMRFNIPQRMMRVVPEIDSYSDEFSAKLEDPIHADAHDQLDFQGQTVLNLISACFDDCLNINFDDHQAKTIALTRLQLLRSQVEAQNMNSSREIRMTLKNVSTTQRRATQSVRDLVTKLRKERDMLRRENNALKMEAIAEIPNDFDQTSPKYYCFGIQLLGTDDVGPVQAIERQTKDAKESTLCVETDLLPKGKATPPAAMMIVLHDPNTLLHETVELLGSKLRPALESPERIKSIVAAVKDSDHEFITTLASDEDEQAVLSLAAESHNPQYLDHLRTVHDKWVTNGLIDPSESVLPECFRFSTHATQGQDPPIPQDPFALAGYYAFDMSSGISARSYKSILASANLAVQAVHHSALTTTVTALARPPGHHCNGTLAGGYCYINNIALSLASFRQSWSGPSPPRIAILDLDFHHGNGTQDITYQDPHVLYVSIHGAHEFPYYSGFTSETGPPAPHPAHNTTHNFPLPTGSSFATYLETLNAALSPIKAFKPDLLLVSLGFDTYHLDPLGNFKIETDDYAVMARTVREATRGVRAAILLEGGYVVEDLGKNLLSFMKGWEEGEC